MAQRVWILNGSNLMQDKDVGTLLDVLTPATGFILNNGLAVTTNTVAIGKCLIHCTRTSTTPNEDLWVVFENTAAVTIDTSGTKKVWIAITQANINDGSLNVDPTGASIGAIATGAAYPAGNYIPLASITGGVITDARPTSTLGSHVVNGILKLTTGTPIASATTTDLSTVVGNNVHITGTTTITALGTLPAGTQMTVIFDGALTLTHNASSLILPGSANITTAANDVATFVSEWSGNWRCEGYQKANWTSLIQGATSISWEVRIWTMPTAPANWFICDGAAYSRATYAALFNILNPSKWAVTITLATPGVVTLNGHKLNTWDSIYLTTTGALPTGLAINTRYWVVKVDANTFSLATSLANALAGTKIATSVSQSGTHTMFLTPYGNGNGTTTFNIPNLKWSVVIGVDITQVEFAGLGEIWGEKTHLLTWPESGIQAHSHTVWVSYTGGGIAGAGANNTLVNASVTSSTAWPTNASTAHNNLQPYVAMNYIIAQ